MQNVNLYIETDSRYVGKSRKKYGYLLEFIHNGQPIIRYEFGVMEGTWHQVTLTALAAGLQRLNQTCHVTIFSQDEYILNMIDSDQPVLWAANDFAKMDGTPVANRPEWKRLWNCIKEQEVEVRQGGHSYSRWMLERMKKGEEKNA